MNAEVTVIEDNGKDSKAETLANVRFLPAISTKKESF